MIVYRWMAGVVAATLLVVMFGASAGVRASDGDSGGNVATCWADRLLPVFMAI
jgi:hypothetical protein